MGDFSDPKHKVLWGWVKNLFFIGASASKVLESLEFSGMSCLKVFFGKGKNPKEGGGLDSKQRPPPHLRLSVKQNVQMPVKHFVGKFVQTVSEWNVKKIVAKK